MIPDPIHGSTRPATDPLFQSVAARGAGRRLLRRPGAVLAGGVLFLVLSLSAFAPVVARFSPRELHVEDRFAPPNSVYWLGTDELGRNLLSRALYGGRLALGISLGATLLAMIAGVAWAGIAAMRQGWVDDVLMRIGDAAMAVPMVLAALILVAAFGPSVRSLIITIGILEAPWTARVIRADLLGELKEDYCLAARALGASRTRIFISEVLPNTIPTLMVQSVLNLSIAILIEAGLSFFGLGVQPPQASWGTLLLEGYRQIYLSPTYAIIPGVLIFITIWALNALSDHLQVILQSQSDG